jgi:hypothetical protein
MSFWSYFLTCEFESILRLIDVLKTTGGMFAQVVADQQRRQAVCFLEKNPR